MHHIQTQFSIGLKRPEAANDAPLFKEFTPVRHAAVATSRPALRARERLILGPSAHVRDGTTFPNGNMCIKYQSPHSWYRPDASTVLLMRERGVSRASNVAAPTLCKPTGAYVMRTVSKNGLLIDVTFLSPDKSLIGFDVVRFVSSPICCRCTSNSNSGEIAKTQFGAFLPHSRH